MVFQHFSLFDALTVAENIALAAARQCAALQRPTGSSEVSRRLRPAAAPGARCRLSVGERQRIEIVRCLLQDPKLLIIDEPTSVLTPAGGRYICSRPLHRLAGEGCALLYITHRLEEVKRLCDRATIMRRGKVVAERSARRNGGDAGRADGRHPRYPRARAAGVDAVRCGSRSARWNCRRRRSLLASR